MGRSSAGRRIPTIALGYTNLNAQHFTQCESVEEKLLLGRLGKSEKCFGLEY